jgi:HEPN domain-containing protein
MPDPDKVAEVVSEWVIRAEDDLKTTQIILRAGTGMPTSTAAFHAQQCIEKYIKALLTARGIQFPKTHNIRRLVEMLPADAQLSLSQGEQDELTDYATGARYPGGGEVSTTEARRALALARRVRSEIRRQLPKEARRRRKH